MATRSKKSKKPVGSLVPAADRHVVDESLKDFGRRNMTIYGTTVNLDRSVPDLYDGLKPVQRRILWSASQVCRTQFEKSARLTGHCMGAYHPHGNSAIYSAAVNMVQHPSPTLLGKGNFGSMTDGAAAERYTNVRLSHYGQTFFDSDYINGETTSFVPNYDDKDVEPVTLPAQLPNVLLNGGEGIGVGITTKLPTFTPESVLEVLNRMFKGEKLQAVDFAQTLKYHHKWGGQLVRSKENQAQWKQMFVGSMANLQFEAVLDLDRDHKRMTISSWPPGTNLETFMKKVRAMPECHKCFNSKGTTTYQIECKPGFNYDQFDKFVEKVRKATMQRQAFKINVTRREAKTVDGVTTFKTEFLALSVPDLILQWCRMRVALELKSLAYRIKKQEAAIAYSKLLIYAVDKLDLIFKALRQSDPDASLQKLLKITAEQAKQILDLQVRKLSKLDQSKLKGTLKTQEQELKQLQTWQAKPKAKVLLDLAAVQQALDKDRNFKFKESTQKLTVV